MDLGEPIDLLSILMPPLQPGPPPSAAFDEALANVMGSDLMGSDLMGSQLTGPQLTGARELNLESLADPAYPQGQNDLLAARTLTQETLPDWSQTSQERLASIGPEMQWSMSPSRRLPEPAQTHLPQAGLLPPLRAMPELPIEELPVETLPIEELPVETLLEETLTLTLETLTLETLPLETLPLETLPPETLPKDSDSEEPKTPVLPVPVDLGMTLPPSLFLSIFPQGGASPEALNTTPFVAPPLAEQGAVVLNESSAVVSDSVASPTQESLPKEAWELPPKPLSAGLSSAPLAAEPPPLKGLHQRLRDRIQHLAPKGTRVLQSDAGQAPHPLMDLEHAAGARWNQLAQLTPPAVPLSPEASQRTKKGTLGTLTSETQPTAGAHLEAPSLPDPELPEASAAPKMASQVPQETPEEWVPIPKYLELEIDAELSLSMSAHGREIELSLDGSAEALAPLANMENELRESLNRDGWTLRDFNTRERGQSRRQDQPKRTKPSPAPKGAPSARPVPRGAHINRVA